MSLTCRLDPIRTEIQCCVYDVELALKTITVCILYRKQKFRLSKFFPQFEDLLYDLKRLNHRNFGFGDYNINFAKHSTKKLKFEPLASAYDFQFCNSEPTRVTRESETTRLDHLLLGNKQSTETVRTATSDHFLVIMKIPYEVSDNGSNSFRRRNLLNLKRNNSLNFLFISDQKMKRMVNFPPFLNPSWIA